MLNIIAKSFMTATRNDHRARWNTAGHWPDGERYDTRRSAELQAHTVARRRD